MMVKNVLLVSRGLAKITHMSLSHLLFTSLWTLLPSWMLVVVRHISKYCIYLRVGFMIKSMSTVEE